MLIDPCGKVLPFFEIDLSLVILCCWHNLRLELLIDEYVPLQLFRMQVLKNQSHAVLTLTKWNHLSFVLLILLLPQLVLHHLNFLVILILLLFQLDDLPELDQVLDGHTCFLAFHEL